MPIALAAVQHMRVGVEAVSRNVNKNGRLPVFSPIIIWVWCSLGHKVKIRARQNTAIKHRAQWSNTPQSR